MSEGSFVTPPTMPPVREVPENWVERAAHYLSGLRPECIIALGVIAGLVATVWLTANVWLAAFVAVLIFLYGIAALKIGRQVHGPPDKEHRNEPAES